MLKLTQIRFCARECELQQSGEYSVANMCEAYIWAVECARHEAIEFPLTLAFIRRLGQKIEPNKNENGFRLMPVYFKNDQTKQALNPEHIEQALNSLLKHGDSLSANETYVEFQKIHPFNDGNGRAGAILWNIFWMGGDHLNYPEILPDLFKE